VRTRRIIAGAMLAIHCLILTGLFLLAGKTEVCGSWPTLPASSLPARLRDLSDLPAGAPFELSATPAEVAGALVARISDPRRSPLAGLHVRLEKGRLILDACLRDIFLAPAGVRIVLTPSASAGSPRFACDGLSVGRLRLPTWACAFISRQLDALWRQAGPRWVIEKVEITPELIRVVGRIGG